MSAKKDIPLTTLLAFPYLWSPKKCIQFVKETWTIIDVKDKTFKKQLDQNYKQYVSKNWDWIDILGKHHWEILRETSNNKPPQSANGKSITELLRLIRNKHEHIRDLLGLIVLKFKNDNSYDAAVYDIKCWFDKNGKLIPQNFITFWLNKYPFLLPFIYVNCYEHRNNDSLRKFYSNRTDRLNNNYFLNPDEYITNLQNSLARHLEQGSLLERYKYEVDSKTCQLEIRGCRELDIVLNGSLIVFIEVNSEINGSLTVKHFSYDGLYKTVELNGLDRNIGSFSMVFTNDIADLEVWNFCSKFSNRIIVFGDEYMDYVGKEFIQDSLSQYDKYVEVFEFQMTWDEIDLISPAKKKQIFDQGIVLIQGREVLLKNILTDCQGLSGNLLYQLIQGKKSNVFGKYQLLKRDDVYLERKISVSGIIQLEKMLEYFPNDIFIVSNISLQMLEIVTESKAKENLLEHIESLKAVNIKSNGKIFLVKEYEDNFQIIVDKCERTEDDLKGSIHYIHFDKEDGISRLVKTVYSPACKLDADEFYSGSENQFIETIYRSNIEPLIFIAPPGSGKSQLFASLSEKLTSKSFVINIPMRDFVQRLKGRVHMSREVNKSDIREILKKFIKCSDSSEEFIINQWFAQQSQGSERIELMIDGFDELPDKTKKYGSKILRIIRKEIPRIRIWLTSRETLQYDGNNLLFFPCTVHPFSESDQVRFICEYWRSLREAEIPNKEKHLTYKFAVALLQEFKSKLGSDVVTTPLHCRVLAEYFEDKLENGIKHNSTDKMVSIAHIYDSLINKKFQVYLDKDYKLGNYLIESLFLVHTYLGIKMLLPEEEHGKFIAPRIEKHLSKEAFLKMGIVTCNNPFTFNHRTFAEFLIARLICEVLEQAVDLRSVCDLISFQKLLVEILTNSDEQNDRPVVSKFLNDLLEDKDVAKLAKKYIYLPTFKTGQSYLNCLKMTFRFKLEKVSWLILNIWCYQKTDEFYSDVLIAAISHDVPNEFFVELSELFEFNQSSMDICNTSHFKIFEIALKRNFDISKYLIDTWFSPNQWENIHKMTNGRGHIMHIILENYPTCSINSRDNSTVKQQHKELIKIVTYVHDLHTKYRAKAGSDITPEIEKLDGKGRTPLLTLPLIDYFGDYIAMRKVLVELLNANVNATLAEGTNALCLLDPKAQESSLLKDAAENYYQTVQLFVNNGFTQLDSKTPEKGLTTLMCAVKCFRDELPEDVLKLFYEKQADFNVKDYEGSTILHHFISKFSLRFIRLLIKYNCDPFIKNKEGKCALCLCIAKKRPDVGELLLESQKNTCDQGCEVQFKQTFQLDQINDESNNED